jgi:hypothetical protein
MIGVSLILLVETKSKIVRTPVEASGIRNLVSYNSAQTYPSSLIKDI